jgi:hypothetical protein
MRRTWRNVCAAIVAERAKAAARTAPPPQSGAGAPNRRSHPRDLPAGVKPSEVIPAPPVTAPGSGRFNRPSAFAKNAKDIVNAVNPTPDELMEGLYRVLNEVSGRR